MRQERILGFFIYLDTVAEFLIETGVITAERTFCLMARRVIRDDLGFVSCQAFGSWINTYSRYSI